MLRKRRVEEGDHGSITGKRQGEIGIERNRQRGCNPALTNGAPLEDRCQVGRQEITLLRALLEPPKVGHLGAASVRHLSTAALGRETR
jgi:hypothetical protein